MATYLGEPENWLDILRELGVLTLLENDLTLWKCDTLLTSPTIKNQTFSSATDFLIAVERDKKVLWSDFIAKIKKHNWRVADAIAQKLLTASVEPKSKQSDTREKFQPLSSFEGAMEYLVRLVTHPGFLSLEGRTSYVRHQLLDNYFINEKISQAWPELLPHGKSLRDILQFNPNFVPLVMYLIIWVEKRYNLFPSFSENLTADLLKQTIDFVDESVCFEDLVLYDLQNPTQDRHLVWRNLAPGFIRLDCAATWLFDSKGLSEAEIYNQFTLEINKSAESKRRILPLVQHRAKSLNLNWTVLCLDQDIANIPK